MHTFSLARTFALFGVLLLATGAWGEESAADGFSYDPALVGEQPLSAQGAPKRLLPIETTTEEGGVRITTETPVAPYLEAVRDQVPTDDELRLLPDQFNRPPLEQYQLGAGVGINVEDRASLNLGYRFHQPLTLLDENSQDPTSPRGDLRIFFDLKLPFD